MELKIKQILPDAHLPGRATAGSAGLDLRALCTEDGITIEPMQRVVVSTGIAIELPNEGYVALLFARSGLSVRAGLALANGVGVIDSDFRGEVGVPLVNLSDIPVHVTNGERIAQLIIMPVLIPEMIELVKELSNTQRGEGGFGSTGEK